MNELERKKFELHTNESGYNQRVERAKRNIETAFERFETPYVSVSGGKDSTVLHHLVTEACGYDNIDVFHFDQGLLAVPGAKEQVEILLEEYGGVNCVRTTEAMYDESISNEERHSHLHSGRHGWIRRLTEERGWNAALLGIRAEESADRRDRYSGTPPTHVMGDQLTVAPIHRLTTEDVWAYIVENGLPYHDQYDRKGELLDGIDSRQNRLSSFHSPGLDRFGERTISSFLYPEESNKRKELGPK
jgi:3'-phosphoadenosine 5'-phosphosulfate sulfotransferase (PAPS reductase)/FAD synthetase